MTRDSELLRCRGANKWICVRGGRPSASLTLGTGRSPVANQQDFRVSSTLLPTRLQGRCDVCYAVDSAVCHAPCVVLHAAQCLLCSSGKPEINMNTTRRLVYPFTRYGHSLDYAAQQFGGVCFTVCSCRRIHTVAALHDTKKTSPGCACPLGQQHLNKR